MNVCLVIKVISLKLKIFEIHIFVYFIFGWIVRRNGIKNRKTYISFNNLACFNVLWNYLKKGIEFSILLFIIYKIL